MVVVKVKRRMENRELVERLEINPVIENYSEKLANNFVVVAENRGRIGIKKMLNPCKGMVACPICEHSAGNGLKVCKR